MSPGFSTQSNLSKSTCFPRRWCRRGRDKPAHPKRGGKSTPLHRTADVFFPPTDTQHYSAVSCTTPPSNTAPQHATQHGIKNVAQKKKLKPGRRQRHFVCVWRLRHCRRLGVPLGRDFTWAVAAGVRRQNGMGTPARGVSVSATGSAGGLTSWCRSNSLSRTRPPQDHLQRRETFSRGVWFSVFV